MLRILVDSVNLHSADMQKCIIGTIYIIMFIIRLTKLVEQTKLMFPCQEEKK